MGGNESVRVVGIEHLRNAIEHTPQPPVMVMASPVGVHMAGRWWRLCMRGRWRERRAEHGGVGRNGEPVGAKGSGRKRRHRSRMDARVVVWPSTGLTPARVMDDGLQRRERRTVHFLRGSPGGKFVFGLLSPYGFLPVFKSGVIAQGLVCVVFGEATVELLVERLELLFARVYSVLELFDRRTLFVSTGSPKGIGKVVTVLDTLIRLVLE